MTDSELLKQKITDWRECLGGTGPNVDNNTISGLLYLLYWDKAVYASYTGIGISDNTSPFATPLFKKAYTRNYLHSQLLYIRRLCEVNPQTNYKDKSIYSLRRIVDEMKLEYEKGRYTKENICIAFGIPLVNNEPDPIPPISSGDVDIRISDKDKDLIITYAFHQKIYGTLDNICNKHGLLKKNILNKLDKWLLVDKNDSLNKVIYHVDKYIARSASLTSRDWPKDDKEFQLDINEIQEVINNITKAFFICNKLAFCPSSPLTLLPLGWDKQVANLSSKQGNIVSETWKKVNVEIDYLREEAYEYLIHLDKAI